MTEITQQLTIDLEPRVPGSISLTEQAYSCDNCSRINVMSHAIAGGNSYSIHDPYRSEIEWIPNPRERQEFIDVPDHISGAASEATLCLSTGAYRAVGALARAVIEATAKEKGIVSGRLVEKIDAMYDAGLLREHIKEAAHEVRHFGNDMAHGDFVDAVSEGEASEAIALMTEVLNEVFQSPARVARVREGREAKKAAIQNM